MVDLSVGLHFILLFSLMIVSSVCTNIVVSIVGKGVYRYTNISTRFFVIILSRRFNLSEVYSGIQWDKDGQFVLFFGK